MAPNHKRAARNAVPIQAQSTDRLQKRVDFLLEKLHVREAVEAIAILQELAQREMQEQQAEAYTAATVTQPQEHWQAEAYDNEPIEMPSPDNLPDEVVRQVLKTHDDLGKLQAGAPSPEDGRR